MNRTYFICFLFALIVARSSLAHAQNMFLNGDFEINCGTNAVVNASLCSTFTATCIPGWSISHGTPYLYTAGGIVGPSSIVMWHDASPATDIGEGIFATLNEPTPINDRYELCFYYRLAPTSNGSGNLVVRFTTGLLPSGGPCGQPISPTATEYVAYNSPVIAGGWQQVIITANYPLSFTQLNVYPVALSNEPLMVEVDGFQLNYCGTNLLATPTSLPMPSGFYSRTGNITASSQGGTGFVTADPSVSTTFRAGQYVLLEPNFVAIPNGDKYFLAEIGPCGCGSADERFAGAITSELTSAGIAFDEHLRDRFEAFDVALFPNPASETVTLNANAALDQVRVLDLSGKVLLERFSLDGLQVLKLDMSEFPSGVYLVESQSKIGDRVVTKLVKE